MKGRKTLSFLALLGLLVLAGCASGAAASPTPTAAAPTATFAPKTSALELTFLGSDGNVWEMAWPGGTPKRLTSDAQADQVRYGGLVWSPDGSRLAVLRETGMLSNPTSDTLLLLSPDGASLARVTLSAPPNHTPFSWSPDGKLIAYRPKTEQVDSTTGIIKGALTIFDAQTGAVRQTLPYDEGRGGGCGGGFSPLENAVMDAHNAYLGLDTFVWTPDQQSLLLARSCGNNDAVRVDLDTGKATAGYPAGASYQPGSSSVLLGQWYVDATISLGLANASGAQQRVLVSEMIGQSGQTPNTTIGVATWAGDGQAVYFERDNGIWRIGADGSNARQIISGAPNDSQNQATVEMLPSLSPDGSLLLYLQLHGANGQQGVGSVTSQCYVAQPDGSHATALPQGATSAVWRPVK